MTMRFQFFIIFLTFLAVTYENTEAAHSQDGAATPITPTLEFAVSSNPKIQPQPQPTIKPTTTTSTTPPTTTSTTTPTTTSTTPSTTTSTTPSTTTSTTPPTTTSTTTPTTTSTTTPITTSTSKPTPSPTPAPVPDPVSGDWSVQYKDSNRSCIVIDMAVQFEILKVNQTATKLNLPKNATANGTCENEKNSVSLNWNGDKNVLEFEFVKSNTSKFILDVISVKFINLTIPGQDPKTYQLIHKQNEFSTPLGNSYKCSRVQTLNLTEENSNETVAYIHLSQVQFEAFSNTTGHVFATAVDCDTSLTTDVVPIVVGCVLAALVVMVLIAYLIGRRRCQARGYLSM
ncbi:lysosome-associated membrane glycoprotein 1 [Leptinotarsa decemlineata]|uniref:lysosome-associated membrane glycoprotein 1 n=1 Tax=Leptinotarsa decemlineata TaxID=7539 RepID=UPI003D30BF35